MIERYTLAPMRDLWSDRLKYEVWKDVETAAAMAMGAPEDVVDTLMNSNVLTPSEIAEEEAVTRHDVVAFLQVWRRNLPTEAARWVHRNMTSSDLVDSANAVLLRHVNDEIEYVLRGLLVALGRHALAHRNTLRAARTHGQHAEESTWGYRAADLFAALWRAYDALGDAAQSAQVGKLSGPVGDYKYISPEEEREFCRRLGINSLPTATQVVARDGYAELVFTYSRIATAIEALALEVRLGQRTEVAELFEGFAPGQRGSSAMPHKRNPITSEQLCGLAKIVRAQVGPVLEGMALHHEQDLSHSSVERIALRTASTLTHYMIVTATRLVENLVVDVSRMAHNARLLHGDTLSAFYRNWLVSCGVQPDTAWEMVAEASGGANDLVERMAERGLPVPDGPQPPRTGPAFEFVQAAIDHLIKILRIDLGGD